MAVKSSNSLPIAEHVQAVISLCMLIDLFVLTTMTWSLLGAIKTGKKVDALIR